MNNINRIITKKANHMSLTPNTPVPQSPNQQPLRSTEATFPSLAVSDSMPKEPTAPEPPTPQPEPAATQETSPEPQPTVDMDKMKTMIHTMKDQLDAMLRIIDGKVVADKYLTNPKATTLETGETIIEGVFNGEKMVGEDGKEYNVSQNYASKSKMVEGDMLKLTITNGGKYIYKQIGPIERKRITGELVKDTNNNQWAVLVDGKTYKILQASVTFYKANAGDNVTILVPEHGPSSWGAVDAVKPKQ